MLGVKAADADELRNAERDRKIAAADNKADIATRKAQTGQATRELKAAFERLKNGSATRSAVGMVAPCSFG